MGGGRILNVLRKPRHCPRCGIDSEVWPIIYKTGDWNETDFFFIYRKEGVMGGDNIPRRPPIWGCSCCNLRFRKVLPDGTDAPVKLRFLENERKGKIVFTSFDENGNEYTW